MGAGSSSGQSRGSFNNHVDKKGGAGGHISRGGSVESPRWPVGSHDKG